MSIELTPHQQHDLDSHRGALPRVIDPRNNATYVLVPEADYEAVREVLSWMTNDASGPSGPSGCATRRAAWKRSHDPARGDLTAGL